MRRGIGEYSKLEVVFPATFGFICLIFNNSKEAVFECTRFNVCLGDCI